MDPSESTNRAPSEGVVSRRGSVASRLGLASSSSSHSWSKPDKWVRAVDRAESRGWGSAIGFVAGRAEQGRRGEQGEGDASRGVWSSVEV